MTAGMRRSRVWQGCAALWFASTMLCAQTPPAVTNEDPRSVLLAEQASQTRALDVQEQACYARFFATDCLHEVARKRRTMQTEFRRKTAALDAADRQQRAQEAQERVQAKQDDQRQRQADGDAGRLGPAASPAQAPRSLPTVPAP